MFHKLKRVLFKWMYIEVKPIICWTLTRQIRTYWLTKEKRLKLQMGEPLGDFSFIIFKKFMYTYSFFICFFFFFLVMILGYAQAKLKT